MSDAETFGARLRELRKAAEMSQADLAGWAGIDHTYLSKIEHDATPPPSEGTITRMAAMLCPDDDDAGGLRRLREELLLRAGKVPPDIRAIICAHPEALALLRERYGERSLADPSGAPATDDAALAPLLDAYGQAEYEFGQVAERVAFNPATVRRIYDRKEAARSALLTYLDAHYVRRDRLYDDGPWSPGDGSADGAAQASQS